MKVKGEMRSLADALRSSLAPTAAAGVSGEDLGKSAKIRIRGPKEALPEIVQQILDYDSSENRSMVHARLDVETARLVGHFKMATGVDNIKLVAFAVRYLFATRPELKALIKHYIQNLDL